VKNSTAYIGEQLRELKEELQVSQDELAEMLCISQGTLSKYMNNRIPAPFEFVIIIPKKIKSKAAKNVMFAWKKQFEEDFLEAVTG
jgi:transcriptional regulator with XRE-family HTH domain